MALRDRLGRRLLGALTVSAVWSSRHAVLVVAGFLVAAVLAGAYTALNLGVNTDTGRMISSSLPFRQSFQELLRTFPALDENLVVVVEADDPDIARAAARSLVVSFRTQPELFEHVYAPGVGAFYETHGLLYLENARFDRVTQRLEAAAPMLDALAARPDLGGLAGLTGTIAGGVRAGRSPDGAGILFASVADVVDARLAGTSRVLDWQGLLAGETEPERQRWFIFVRPALDYSRLEPAGPALEAARQLIADPEATFSGAATIKLTGEVALNAEEMQTVIDGAILAGILSFILVGLILTFGIGSLRQVIAALVMLAVGLVLTACVATLTIGYLNLISVAFAVLFVGLGIDYAIHFCLRYDEERRFGYGHGDALAMTARGVGTALLLSTATTAIGFLAFTPTDFVGMAQLGIISSAGMVVALVCASTFLPALLGLLHPAPIGRVVGPGMVARLVAKALSIPWLRRGVTVLILLAALASLFAIPAARFDGDPLSLKDPDAPAVQAFRELLQDPDAPVYTAEIIAGSRDRADELARRFEALPEVQGVVSIASFIPKDQPTKLDRLAALDRILPDTVATDTPALSAEARRAALADMEAALTTIAEAEGVTSDLRLPANHLRDSIAAFRERLADDPQALAALEQATFQRLPTAINKLDDMVGVGEVTVATLDEPLRERFVSADGRYRLEILPRADLSDEQAMRRFVEAVRTVSWNVTGTPIEIVGAAQVVSESMLLACALAAALITAVLFAMLHRALDVALVLAPITLAGLILVAATVVLGIPFNFANVIVLPLLIGLGVDSGIHLVIRVRETDEPAYAVLASSTPRAVLLSALTTVASFGTLAISEHRGTASMGLLLVIAIILTLICTLFVLPTLVEWAARRGRRGEE